MALVVKSIETGCLLNVLSRKTVYFKEGKSAGKMTVTPHESHQEIGFNGEVFVEKTIKCYREINMQTYLLNPYLSYLIVRQMSNKNKHMMGGADSFRNIQGIVPSSRYNLRARAGNSAH
ncbi:RNA_pol_Rpb2_6 domain-containing protein [Trichonephila clavipes]|uniref:RNA_pol_Rpb2_6 domain-containing protein n=1 Tax=Trichonephila clavipes TaxID=2585209 RepID=A0A8X6SBQ3_TRICX|nr:RNA_pol_Rpb2_6 domain-containing protein [Trichonephila clavipes]